MSSARGTAAAIALALAALSALAPGPAAAGEGTDNCTGFISSIPATISTQGVWCLASDLSTASIDVAAVQVVASNVTIDCNGHLLANTSGAGNSSTAIRSLTHANMTVRRCDIRGFLLGVVTGSGSGHLVEDNRFHDIRATAIYIDGGDGNMVRRNRIEDTGGSTSSSVSGVIRARADVLDNVIDGVSPQPGSTAMAGIIVGTPDVEVARNVVRGFAPGAGSAIGISTAHARVAFVDNLVVAGSSKMGTGITAGGAGAPTTFCLGNRVEGFNNAMSGCGHMLDNITP